MWEEKGKAHNILVQRQWPLGNKKTSPLLNVLAAIVIGTLVTVGCGKGSERSPGLESTVRGMVVAVEAASLAEVQYLTVLDDSGKIWEFTANGFVGFTPSHLREHKIAGQPVIVNYRNHDGRLIIVDITD